MEKIYKNLLVYGIPIVLITILNFLVLKWGWLMWIGELFAYMYLSFILTWIWRNFEIPTKKEETLPSQ